MKISGCDCVPANNITQQLKVNLITVCFFLNFRESLCHIHGLVIYKDIENPVRKNEALQEELQNLKHELNENWKSYSTPAKKSEWK